RIAVNVVAGNMIALPREHAREPAIVRLIGILQAHVGPRAGLDAIIPCHLIQIEQVGIVEDDAARVLVRQMTLRAAAVARDDLSQRLDHMRACRRVRNERIGVEHTGGGYAARLDLIIDWGEGYRIEGVMERIEVAPEIEERSEEHTSEL